MEAAQRSAMAKIAAGATVAGSQDFLYADDGQPISDDAADGRAKADPRSWEVGLPDRVGKARFQTWSPNLPAPVVAQAPPDGNDAAGDGCLCRSGNRGGFGSGSEAAFLNVVSRICSLSSRTIPLFQFPALKIAPNRGGIASR